MDRSDFSCDRPGAAILSRIPESTASGHRVLARRVLVASLALALSACASRGGELDDDAYLAGASILDEATDANGEFVVNRALLRQARDELAVMSQPATPEMINALAHNQPPRSVNETRTDVAAPAGGRMSDAEAAAGAQPAGSPSASNPSASNPPAIPQPESDQVATGRSSGGLLAAVPAAAVVADRGAEAAGEEPNAAGTATQAIEPAAGDARMAAAPGGQGGSGQGESGQGESGQGESGQAEGSQDGADQAEGAERPGLFGRMFGWLRPGAGEAAGGAAATGVVATGAMAAGAGVGAGVGAGETGTAAAGSVAEASVVEPPVVEASAATPAASAPVAAADPQAGAAASRPDLPRPGEPGYLVSGHSSGGMQLARAPDPQATDPAIAAAAGSAGSGPAAGSAAAGPAAMGSAAVGAAAIGAGNAGPGAADRAVASPVTGGTAVIERASPSIATVTVSPPAAPLPPPSTPAMSAALGGNPAATTLPPVADVAPLDEATLERGSFATLMGAMHGMVERCEPPTQMRDQALKTFRATYPAVDLDRGSRDDPAARIRYDEEFVRSATATLGSSSVNCDYVRSQSYGWNQLVGDLRHMSRDSARQYRPGLIMEISRGAGIGRY